MVPGVGKAQYDADTEVLFFVAYLFYLVIGFKFNSVRFLYLFKLEQNIQKRTAQLKYISIHDSLTGLPNRNMFHNRLEQEIAKSKRADLSLALLLVDLDEFKDVNDTLGHEVGDLLLKEAARRIKVCVRDSDTVARLGGDEFTIILSELNAKNKADNIAEKIIASLAEEYSIGEEVIHISGSIGITLYPEDATDIDALIKSADQAMYTAKHNGRNCYSYFTQSLQDAAQKRLRLTNDLRSALDANQLEVYYQPIIDLNTGYIHKAEALLRWPHPQRGMVDPLDFIPLAEKTGLINIVF